MELYLGLDLGTTSIKASLIDETGKIRSFVTTANPIQRKNKNVRQDVFHLMETATQTLDRCILEAKVETQEITLMAVSSQRESFAFFDLGGCSPLFCWQDGTKPESLNLTSNHRIATVDTLLFHHLSNKKLFITDPTQASYARFDTSRAQKAEIVPSKGSFGNYRGIPIKASLADQPASLFALGKNSVLSLGTGAFFLSSIDPEIAKTFKGTKYKGVHDADFYTECSIASLAPIFNTIVENFSPYRTFEEFASLAASALDSKGLFYHPELTLIKGFESTTGVAEWLKALLEGFVFSLKELIDRGQKNHETLYSSIPITGGVSKMNYLCQLLSDLTGIAFVRPKFPETALLGALKLASGNPFTKLLEEDQTFSPQPNGALHESYRLWREAFYGV